MTPLVQKVNGPGSGSHAHLLVEESGGLVAMESPEAVIQEVAFRATHVSSLMEEMFQQAQEHDLGEIGES